MAKVETKDWGRLPGGNSLFPVFKQPLVLQPIHRSSFMCLTFINSDGEEQSRQLAIEYRSLLASLLN